MLAVKFWDAAMNKTNRIYVFIELNLAFSMTGKPVLDIYQLHPMDSFYLTFFTF